MSHSDTARLHAGASVAASAALGDFVVAYAGAEVGEGCRVRGYTQLWPGVRLEAGAELGPNVTLEAPANGQPANIVIGADARVGAGALICQGVRLGQGAVVAAGAVVAQNVPPYAIVSGAPARITDYVQNASGAPALDWHQRATFPEQPSVVPLGVGGVTLHRFKFLQDPRGDLSVGEFEKEIPFLPKRYFLVLNVPSDKTRGEHAHRECHQFLICVKGSCAVVVDDLEQRCEVQLDSPDVGVYLPPMTWGIQYKYSSDAVLLVFASHYYEAGDYIRDYDAFVAEKRARPQEPA
ncbi:serine acetyltransferase [Duganella sp. 1224]|uniref:WxcM-like domain-containing protein n=1 Tax=Duganella sp. 1224 TaxID=2587052 RepID=UPI0015CA3D17|nr:WxcM-like domain-containing protein [Duganella sp. 1224]NYE64102.1 serine acetyltransferase [Duganella sp. 1224]